MYRVFILRRNSLVEFSNLFITALLRSQINLVVSAMQSPINMGVRDILLTASVATQKVDGLALTCQGPQ